ncbi:MAG: AmmeMemoRadiSam system protein A [Firmicutes bacterium]|nr:AmmeMemoRadiSam system protein A [Candidatus Fermentithermobacillaceae bacterium]
MQGNVVLAGLSPHPAIIIPEVGRGEEQNAINTVRAMDELGKAFCDVDIDTLVIITPHGPVFSDAVSMLGNKTLQGDFGDFGAARIKLEVETDLELVECIRKNSQHSSIPCVILDRRNVLRYGAGARLDHGVLVPLYYLRKHGFSKPVIVVNIGFLQYTDLYRFGRTITESASELGKKVAVLASGDLSHRLQPGAPAGYNPMGSIFDETLVDYLSKFSVEDILTMPSDLIQDAGECGLRPICIMLGTLDEAQVVPRVLSYEGPFGVGYGVALFTPKDWNPSYSRLDKIMRTKKEKIERLRSEESYPVSLARRTVETYIREGKIPAFEDVPEEFRGRAGVFVTIHKEGDLRGCIGTTEPTQSNIAEEIVINAINAATRDPRFHPISRDELGALEYSVDILSEPVKVTDLSELDPKVYGVICEKGNRRGLLLPDLPGVDTVSEQLSIAKRKAGIDPYDKDVTIYKFTVKRYT